MSDFRRYEKLVSSLPAPLAQEFEQLETRIAQYRERASDILEDVIQRFMQEGVFPKLKNVSFLRDSFKHGDKIFAPNCLFFTGHDFEIGQDMAHDKEGRKIAELVATAAKTHKIPVDKCMSFIIIDKEQKVKNGPKLLLLALATYAIDVHRGALAVYANDAATKVNELIKEFDGLERAK